MRRTASDPTLRGEKMRRAERPVGAAPGTSPALSVRAAAALSVRAAAARSVRAAATVRRTSPGPGRRPTKSLAVVVAAFAVLAVLAPAAPDGTRLAVRLAAAVHGLGRTAHQAAIGASRPAPPADPIGALFRITHRGQLSGGHFCTASVVDSPQGDLVMTAAHCVSGLGAGQFAFVPGFRDGRTPYGVW